MAKDEYVRARADVDADGDVSPTRPSLPKSRCSSKEARSTPTTPSFLNVIYRDSATSTTEAEVSLTPTS